MSVINTMRSGLARTIKKHRATTVSEVEALSPRIRRVRLSGDGLRGFPDSPGQKIKIKLASGQSRSYTPARLDGESGWMDLIFHIHGGGPASDWAASAAPGDAMEIMGPARSVPAAGSGIEWALFLGDETTLGLAAALLAPLPSHVRVLGAIEIDSDDLAAVAGLGLPLDALARRGDFGDVLRDWLDAADLPEGPGAIWFSGHTDTVFALRRIMMNRGFEKQRIKVKLFSEIA